MRIYSKLLNPKVIKIIRSKHKILFNKDLKSKYKQIIINFSNKIRITFKELNVLNAVVNLLKIEFKNINQYVRIRKKAMIKLKKIREITTNNEIIIKM